ncbi:hypothetical protein TD95_002066 [Thielaviopsis punctulata]|uniref:Cation/H+ exchanger transmembrane domain-containing protein n=1 Tax=Thielaviopsis punctulata TaxID=72032 RepID=A0A0F4ZIN9_9PEZI|nr:hypothetical protein TD95_002066 [Thielaviopsis punctulata]
MASSPTDADIHEILVLISFFFLLSISSWLSAKIFNAGPIGQMLVGMLYGVPVWNLLTLKWQQTFISLGYIGLILIVFEGGLTINLDAMKKHAIMITISGTISLMVPMAVSLVFLHCALNYELVESFILGAALSSTSLGTTFVVIHTVATSFDFSRTRLGTVLIGAVVLNDIVGLVLSAAIDGLGRSAHTAGPASAPMYWVLLSPIAASIVLGTITPLLTTFLLSPVFRWYIEPTFARFKHVSNVLLMAATLTSFLTLAAVAGTSMLLGAFLAGTVVARLPCTHPDAPFMVLSREHGESEPGKTPHFVHTFEKYFVGGQKYILEPMFFASVGFGIPFKELWGHEVLWKGAVYALLMLLSKVFLAILILPYDFYMRKRDRGSARFIPQLHKYALIFGFGMVARGEIGLLTMQIGHNHTSYLTKESFVVAIWAIILNTMAGPIFVGTLMRAAKNTIAEDPLWGFPLSAPFPKTQDWDTVSTASARGRWANRMHSRAVHGSMSRSVSSVGRRDLDRCASPGSARSHELRAASPGISVLESGAAHLRSAPYQSLPAPPEKMGSKLPLEVPKSMIAFLRSREPERERAT